MEDRIRHINPEELSNVEDLRKVMTILLNLVETQAQALTSCREEIQALKDEINRLKKEQGKPKFPSTQKDGDGDGKGDSSNKDKDGSKSGKSKNKNNKKGKKNPKIKIDRTEYIEVEKTSLPSDAVFKYYAEVIQQDLKLVTDNVLYRVAVYYSASEQKTFRGELPSSYYGEFGMGIRSISQLLHHYCDVTQGRLEALYQSLGLQISAGTINNMLLSSSTWVLEEQRQILSSGIKHSPYTQIDGTKSVERGVRKVTQIICGAYFSTFYTMDNKSRLQAVEALLGKPEGGLAVSYNKISEGLLADFSVSQADQKTLAQLFHLGQTLTLNAFETRMKEAAPSICAKKNIYQRIKESMVLGYYYSQEEFPIVACLLSDDAPEYRKIAKKHGLCWLHDVRYYRKLVPKIEIHRKILSDVLTQYWVFYQQLLDFKALPSKEQFSQKEGLKNEFKRIFTQKTDYFQVNACLERTLNNQDKLLAVLDNPALPLHNNEAELGARRVVRKRDISLHTWSPTGTKVRDAFMSIAETASKLGVSALDYINDRVRKNYQMPSLASLIVKVYQ